MVSALEQTRISNEGPRYDAEYIKELKASTPSSRPRLPLHEDLVDADISMDVGDSSAHIIELDIGMFLRQAPHRQITYLQRLLKTFLLNRQSKWPRKRERGFEKRRQVERKITFLCLSLHETTLLKVHTQKVG